MTPPRPRTGILDIAPYIGGEANAEAARLIRLASNENPYGPSPKAVAALRAMAPEAHRYPDGGCTTLREKIAALHGFAAGDIVCGAGLDELINIIARTYAGSGDEVLYSEHGFLMYPIAAKAAGAIPVHAPEKNLRADPAALLAAMTPRTKILYLANPNNPTGSYLNRDAIHALHAKLPENVLLMLDAAYAEFVTANDYSAGHELVAAGNVVIGHTFSKIHGIAGLRLGWVHTSTAIADALNRARGPFNVSAAAQVAGLAALDDTDFVAHTRDETARVMKNFAEKLHALGLKVYPSVGNFLLVEFGDRAEAIRLALKSQGILVRQMGTYRLPHTLRITIGTEGDMNDVAAALQDIIHEQAPV